jgi:acetylornithine deacetylase/succinyl-diaminopimelate desuccinylase-like protein
MTRAAAIDRARSVFTSGRFKGDLSRRVAIPTESQNPERAADLDRYIEDEMIPAFSHMGFTCRVLRHARAKGPFLVARRMEDLKLPTVFGYGHGDVIRGLDDRWSPGLSPWTLTEKDGRWYGRGVVDNKGQHSINMAALDSVLAVRGRLGFNSIYLIEMGEEMGSPGLRDVCAEHKDLFAADVLIASDGPRLSADRPTVFLGARGGIIIDLWIDAREGSHHSGNWGGLISNPGIRLAHALASIVGPTGQIRIPEWVPPEVPASVRRVLTGLEIDAGPDGPTVEPWWGEPGLTPAERVFGWCSFEVLAYECGTPKTPVNAIPGRAWSRCQLRFVVGIDPDRVFPALRAHLDRHGFKDVQISKSREDSFAATRLDPDDPWAVFAAASVTRTTGRPPAVLPNLGGSLPNDIFTDILGLKTVWVPHSYPGCSQHAPDEHLPLSIPEEALAIMAGIYWDIGDLGGRLPT